MQLVGDVILALWETTLKMAPWLLGGFLAAGLLSLVVTPELVSRHLGRRAGWRAIVLSVLLGVPLPLCSCGVLPVAVGLRKGGASKGATAAFLISTPQTGIDSFFATYSLLGWAFAVIRPLVATISGLVGGWLVDRLDSEPPAEPTTDSAEADPALRRGQEATPPGQKLLLGVRYGLVHLFGNVAKALFVGLALSALILAFVPDNFFDATLLGDDRLAFPIMLLIGIPMYVCSTASIPVALALMAKGISPGAALIFLIVGPALNGASLTTLLKLLGRTCTLIHLLIIAVAAVLAGLALNVLQSLWQVLPTYATPTESCCEAVATTSLVQMLCAILLLALLAYHLILKPILERVAMNTNASPAAQRITVNGMACDHCRATVRKRLAAYPGVTEVTQSSPTTFDVVGTLPETLAQDLADLGFELAQ